MVVQSDFWRGRRVVVTGHTGFKGGWLSLWLQRLGADVTGYALPPSTQPNLFDVARVGEGMRSIIGDIRDFDNLARAMQEAKPEVVIHLAAQPLVRYSYRAPVETYATNVMGTVHLLEAIRQTPSVRAVVNVTSDKCYENREWHWGYRENEPLGGYDPYSSSKACAELVTAAYRSSFINAAQCGRDIAVATARAGNVIGGGDWAEDRLIPDIVRAIGRGEAVSVRSPEAIRPWQHVLEPLAGYLILAERLYAEGPDYAEAWNFGPASEDAKPVQWIVERITESWGSGASWQHDAMPHPHEAYYLKLDCSKAGARLGWHPRWPLATALVKTVDWYKARQQGEDMKLATLRQVAEYESHSAGVA